MKNITVFNNSPGTVTVKVIKANKTDVSTKSLSYYEETDECLAVDLDVGDMIIVENEGDEFD